MDNIITYDEVVALVANPPSIAPRPNFTNLRNLWHHIQLALQCLRCPQSNSLGCAGLIMSRAMYGLLTTTPFRLPLDPGPEAVYYPTRIRIINAQGDPVLNQLGMPTFQLQPTIDHAKQATINACFKHAKNYYESK